MLELIISIISSERNIQKESLLSSILCWNPFDKGCYGSPR